MTSYFSNAARNWDYTGKTTMSYACGDDSADVPSNADQKKIESMEKISANLCADTNSREFHSTLRWIIYKIVEANKGITYVQLKKILRGEYGIDKRFMDTAIGSLTSPTLLNALRKWHNHKMKEVGAEIGIHLFVKEENDMFLAWREVTLSAFPELGDFVAPVQPSNRNIKKASP